MATLQKHKKSNSLGRNYARGTIVILTAGRASPHTDIGFISGGDKVSACLGKGASSLDKLLGKSVVANMGGGLKRSKSPSPIILSKGDRKQQLASSQNPRCHIYKTQQEAEEGKDLALWDEAMAALRERGQAWR